MADNLSLLIKALLDNTGLDKQMKDLQSLFDKSPIKIKLDIDNADFKQFATNLDKISSNINKSLNIKANAGGIDKLSVTINTTNKELEFMEKRVKEITNAQGQLVKEVVNYKQEVNEAGDAQLVLVKRTEETTDNFKKQRQEQEKLINKLDLFKQKMLTQDGLKGEIDIFASKQKGRFDPGALKTLKDEINALTINTPNLEQKIKSLSVQFGVMRQEAAQSGNVLSRLAENAFKFLRFYLIGQQLVNFIKNIKDGIQYIKELDNALNEIRIVTGQSQQQVEYLAKSYNNLAKEMRVTTKEIAKAAVEFYRQGLATDEVNKRLQDTIKYSKISNVSFEESAQIITATANSMSLSTQRVIDTFTYLGDATATGSDEIGRAFQKVGGTAGALNIEFEKVASWISVISAKTRESSETIGNSVRSILARLQQLRAQGFTQLEDDNLTDVSQVSNALARANIDLFDKNTKQFRDFGLVIDELGAKWQYLDRNTKAYISTALAGTYQQAKFLTLMENYSESVDLYTGALNAAGTANEKFGIYMESTQAKADKFTATVQGMWQNTISSDSIKLIIDMSTAIVQIVDSIGLLNTTIIVATASLLIFNKGFKSFLATKIAPAIASYIAGFRGLAGVASASAISIGGLTISIQALTSALTLGLSIVLPLVISGISWLSKEAERQAEKIGQLKNEYDSLTASLEENADKQEQVIKRLTVLYNLRNDNKITSAENAELTRLEKINDELERQIKYEKALISIKSTELEEKTLKQSDSKSKISDAKMETVGTGHVTYARLTTQEKIQEDIDLINEYNQELKNLNKRYDEGAISAEKYGKEKEKFTGYIQKYSDELSKLIVELEEENKNYVGSTEAGKKRKENNSQLIKTTKDFVIAINNVSDISELASEKTEDVTEKIFNLDATIEKSNKTINEFSSSTKSLASAFDKLNAGEKLSGELLLDLISQYPEYSNQILNMNKSKDAAIQLTKALFEIEKQRTIEKLKNDLLEIESELKKLESIKTAYEFMSQHMPQFALPQNVKNGFAEYNRLVAEINQKTKPIIASISVLKNASLESFFGDKKAKDIYKPIVDIYHQISIELERINQLLSENQTLLDQSSGSDKIALLQKRAELYKQQEEALKRLNVEQEKELKLLQSQLGNIGFKFDVSGNITNYAERLKQLTGDAAKNAEKLIERFVELGRQIPDTNTQILALGKSIKDIGTEVDTYLTDTFGEFYNFLFHSIDKEIEKLEESKKAAQETAKTKIDVIEKVIAQLQKQNAEEKEAEERAKRLNDLAKQRDKLANVLKERNTKMIQADGSFAFVADPRAVRDETEKLQELETDYRKWEEDLRKDKEIQKLKDQITSIQEELRKDEEKYDTQIKNLQKFIQDQKDLLSGANNFQIKSAEDLAKALSGIDEKLYAGRLEALNNFIKSYNTLSGELNTGDLKLSEVSVPKPTTTTPTTTKPVVSATTITAQTTNVPTSAKPISSYTGSSIVDYLKSIGADSSFENRKALSGLGSTYKGTAEQNAALLKKLRGFKDGGEIDFTGLAMVHGSKSQPEAMFNTKQLNNLFKLLNNPFQFKTPQLAFPNVGMAGVGGGITNHYNLTVGEVKTNDAQGLIDNFRSLVNKK